MGQGSSRKGDAWRALAEPSWMLALDPDPGGDEFISHQHGSPSVESSAACQSLDYSGNPGKAPSQGQRAQQSLHPCSAMGSSPAQPVPTAGSGSKRQRLRPSCCQGQRLPRRNCPRRRLPWSQGSGKGRYSPSVSSHRHRTLSPNREERSSWLSKGPARPHVPRAPGDVTAATLDGVSHYRDSHNGLKPPQNPSGWQRDGQRQRHNTRQRSMALLTFSSGSWAVCSFSRHSRLAVGQHKACAITSVLLAQRLGPLPSPAMGLPAAPSTRDGEWKLHPARGEGILAQGSHGSIPVHTLVPRMSPESSEPFPLHAHSACTPSLPPQQQHPPFYPRIPEFFWKKHPCPSGSEVCNPVCWVLPVSTCCPGEHSAPSAAGELALIWHSALGLVQHLAMA